MYNGLAFAGKELSIVIIYMNISKPRFSVSYDLFAYYIQISLRPWWEPFFLEIDPKEVTKPKVKVICDLRSEFPI